MAKEKKTEALLEILTEQIGPETKEVLVVGCGSGEEAGILARAFRGKTIGIDLGQEFPFNHEVSAPARLMAMDARQLDFPSASFDLVYSFHALEHIAEPERALREMARVLRPGGTFLVGTPNKSRMIGHAGSAHPLLTKIKWNLMDLKMRLLGRWSNEAGAHAGFTEVELRRLCQTAFGSATSISTAYYLKLYRRREKLIRFLSVSGAKDYLFPSVYVLGSKQT
jgi:ubiquinone/menaquinone biosynthesis C-methylase UbiE